MLCYWGFSVGATQTQRVPHLYKGTCMLFNKTKISGYMSGVKVVQVTIDNLCSFETIEKICDVLRDETNTLGDNLDFEISVTGTDI